MVVIPRNDNEKLSISLSYFELSHFISPRKCSVCDCTNFLIRGVTVDFESVLESSNRILNDSTLIIVVRYTSFSKRDTTSVENAFHAIIWQQTVASVSLSSLLALVDRMMPRTV